MRILSIMFILLSATPSYGFVDLKEELYQEASHGQISLSYDGARVKLFNEIYLEKDSDGYYVKGVYCEDKYYLYHAAEIPNGHLPDPKYMNTEHTWPQSKFSNRFNKSVQKSDLHHLYPTFSRINSERGNYPFAEVTSIKEVSCDESALGKPLNTGKGTFFEPPDSHKGNVARSMFYFSIRYQMPIDPVQEFYFRQWHILDPIDNTESKHHEAISKIQRNRNPFIDHPELVNQILDF